MRTLYVRCVDWARRLVLVCWIVRLYEANQDEEGGYVEWGKTREQSRKHSR